MTLYRDFIAERFGGKNWVVARRTANVLRQYGENVVCVSRARYAAVEREWRLLYGDPYDAVRAELYCAAKELLHSINPDYVSQDLYKRLDAALVAEGNTK